MKVCWNLTNICNKDCTYCFRELEENALSIEDNKIIMNKLYNAGVNEITFSGGEPFLYPNLKELLMEGKKLNIHMYINTNGTMLRFCKLDDYLPYLEKLTLSLDSPSEFINERIGRGKNNYIELKQLITKIHNQYPNLDIVINTVTSKETINEVDYMFQAISNVLSFNGVKKWKIIRFIPLRGYALLNKNYLEISDEEFNEIKKSYDKTNSSFEIVTKDLNSFGEKFIISPNGSIKRTTNLKENTLLECIKDKSDEEVVRTLGGRHV